MPPRQTPWFATLPERLDLLSIPEPNSGCLLWTGAANSDGYGKVSWQGKQEMAHRMAWVAVNGPVPDGMQVLHKCDVPACVNADHLFLGTRSDNMRDMTIKGRKKGGPRPPPTERTLQIHDAPGSLSFVARQFGVSKTTVWNIKHSDVRGDGK